MSRHYSVQSDGDTIGCVHLPWVTPNVFASAAFVATAFWCTCKMSQCARTFFALFRYYLEMQRPLQYLLVSFPLSGAPRSKPVRLRSHPIRSQFPVDQKVMLRKASIQKCTRCGFMLSGLTELFE